MPTFIQVRTDDDIIIDGDAGLIYMRHIVFNANAINV